MALKTCSKCGKRKLTDAFFKGVGYRDGLRSQCKTCVQPVTNANRRKKNKRTCSKCGQTKEARSFSKSKNVHTWCKLCCKQNAAKWRQENPVKLADMERLRSNKPERLAWQREHGRAYRLFSKYGVTAEEYDALFERQQGVCAICRLPPSKENTRWGMLQVDHCHKTGAVRGLLCGPCNMGLGCLKDDLQRLEGAKLYLSVFTESG